MVKTAIEASKDWLRSAETSLKVGLYEQSLYAMEMSVEIAFKAVLISLSLDFPKVHDIVAITRDYLSDNNKLPQGFKSELQDYLATFNALLGFRPIVGYGFDERFQKVDFKGRANSLLPECRKIVSSCEKATEKIK